MVPLLFACTSCQRDKADASPIATVRHFLDAMDRSAEEESALREAYSLLDDGAQTALSERAARAAGLSGRTYEPWQMLVQGRFRLRFLPSRTAMRERITGERATVSVSGDKAGEHADVPLVREQGKWRIALPIPALRGEPAGHGHGG